MNMQFTFIGPPRNANGISTKIRLLGRLGGSLEQTWYKALLALLFLPNSSSCPTYFAAHFEAPLGWTLVALPALRNLRK